MADQIDVEKLLRLKRYEQPPEGYFEDFVLEFQKRQREELLRRSVWQLAMDRMSGFFESFAIPRPVLAGGFACLVGVAAFVFRPVDDPHSPNLTTAMAVTSSSAANNSFGQGPSSTSTNSATGSVTMANLSGDMGSPTILMPESVTGSMISSPGSSSSEMDSLDLASHRTPHYVMDVRPVSYNASISF